MTLTEWIQTNSEKMYEGNLNLKDLEPVGFSLNDKTVVGIYADDAEMIFEIYYQLNYKNQKIFETMINEDFESFVKILNFCREYIKCA